jgi:hypothetical protein
MARFADLIGSLGTTADATFPAESPAEGAIDDATQHWADGRDTHVEVTAALAVVTATSPLPGPLAPDPTDALAAAFGTDFEGETAESASIAVALVSIDDDLIPSYRPAKSRRR